MVFETRRPERKAWEDWAAETEPVVLEVPEVGTVARSIEVLSVDPPYVTFRQSTHFLTEDTVLDSDSTLRFREREELEESLTRCGFRVTDVREAPDRPGREFVVVGERVG